MPDDTALAGADTSAADAAAAAVAASQAATAEADAAKATADAKARDEQGRFAAKPVDYSTVALPKDSTLDPAVLERTVAIARARGLSVEQAQAALDLVTSEVGTSAKSLTEKVRADTLAAHQPGGAEWTKQLDAWKAETLADVTLGKTPDERKAAIQRGGEVLKKFAAANPEMGEALTKFLDTSGLGERREVVHLMAWLGKAAGERALVFPGDSGIAEDPIVRGYREKSGMNP